MTLSRVLQISTAPAVRPKAHRIEFFLACMFVYLSPMNVFMVPTFFFTASDAFACLCLLAMIAHHSLNLRPLGPGTFLWVIGLAIMVGALFISSLVAGAPVRGLILVGQYLFAFLVVPLILLTRSSEETNFLLKVFVVSMLTVVLHGIYVIHIVGETNTIFVSGSGRLMGLVRRINAGGYLMAFTIPIVLSMMHSRLIHPFLASISIALLAYGVILTASNTALSGLVFGVAIYFIMSANFQRIVIAAAFSVLAAGALSFTDLHAILPEIFQQRVLAGLESGDINEAGTFSDRLLLIREALQLADDTIWLGVGADQYRAMSQYNLPVHNTYLLLWTEGGLPSLIGFVLMLMGIALLVVYAWPIERARPAAKAAIATTVVFLILINSSTHIYGRFVIIPIFISLAPLAAALREEYRHRGRLTHARAAA